MEQINWHDFVNGPLIDDDKNDKEYKDYNSELSNSDEHDISTDTTESMETNVSTESIENITKGIDSIELEQYITTRMQEIRQGSYNKIDAMSDNEILESKLYKDINFFVFDLTESKYQIPNGLLTKIQRCVEPNKVYDILVEWLMIAHHKKDGGLIDIINKSHIIYNNFINALRVDLKNNIELKFVTDGGRYDLDTIYSCLESSSTWNFLYH